jgi:hypothetical protein
LGISSVTSIWKKGHHVDTAKTIEGFNVDKEETTTSEPQQFNPDDPCKNCIHNKKATE